MTNSIYGPAQVVDMELRWPHATLQKPGSCW